jgi:hypothetical protein
MSIGNLPDAAFLDLLGNVWTVVKADMSKYPGVSAQDLTDLDSAKTAFGTTLPAHQAAQAAARSATQAKDADRATGDAILRKIVNVAKAAGASEAAMAALGLPSGSGKAPSHATFPKGTVDTSKRLQHLISWFDNETPENKRKPVGVTGCEIWVKLDGPPPTDQSECQFLTVDSATPYLAEYTGADGGKIAHYMLRWRYRDGSTSAWSETVSATITA